MEEPKPRPSTGSNKQDPIPRKDAGKIGTTAHGILTIGTSGGDTADGRGQGSPPIGQHKTLAEAHLGHVRLYFVNNGRYVPTDLATTATITTSCADEPEGSVYSVNGSAVIAGQPWRCTPQHPLPRLLAQPRVASATQPHTLANRLLHRALPHYANHVHPRHGQRGAFDLHGP